MNRTIKRGQIYYARLNKGCGSEQYGIRPVLIIQNNKGNRFSPTTIVASITSRIETKKHLPTHVYLPEIAGIKYKSVIMLEQIHVIDKCRLIHRIGQLSPKMMKIVDHKLMKSCGLTVHHKYLKGESYRKRWKENKYHYGNDHI